MIASPWRRSRSRAPGRGRRARGGRRRSRLAAAQRRRRTRARRRGGPPATAGRRRPTGRRPAPSRRRSPDRGARRRSCCSSASRATIRTTRRSKELEDGSLRRRPRRPARTGTAAARGREADRRDPRGGRQGRRPGAADRDRPGGRPLPDASRTCRPTQREIEIGDRGRPEGRGGLGRGAAAKASPRSAIDLNLAPVADVATLDSPIADRAFSDDPAVTAEMTAAAVRGLQEGGSRLRRRPLPGARRRDAGHRRWARRPSASTRATLRARDLLPFVAAFDAGAPALVVSHGLYSAFDPVTPASLCAGDRHRPAPRRARLRGRRDQRRHRRRRDRGRVSDPADAAVEAVNAGIDLVQVADPRRRRAGPRGPARGRGGRDDQRGAPPGGGRPRARAEAGARRDGGGQGRQARGRGEGVAPWRS